MPYNSAHTDLVLPIYSYAEADRLANVTRGTSKRWIEGYKYRNEDGTVILRPPVSAPDGREEGGVSFVDLIEVVAIGGLKEVGFSLPRIRTIVRDCEEIFGVQYPIASHRFETDGRELFVQHEGLLVGVLKRKWETAWRELLSPFLKQLEYRDGLAARWWPLGRDIPVVIEPQYGFGLPVVEGTGFRTEIIAERFEHELEHEIAEEFGISALEVKRALQFEISRRDRAA